jgi:hypothetical protein
MRKAFAYALLLCGLVLAGSAAQAEAATIISPVSGVIDSGGPGFGSLTETLDQSGLSIGFTSGVTDFDAYLALNPNHTFVFAGNEWFSNSGSTSAQVTYDLGGNFLIDRLALWNEEAAGIGTLNLLYSTDNVTFLPLASGLTPTDHSPAVTSYLADLFAFAPTTARYVRFDMQNCPQPNNSFPSCAIGEVAFSAGIQQAAVPEPATMLLLGTGLAAAGVRRRLQKRS